MKSKFDIEKTLERLSINPIEDKDLDQAQKRVWNMVNANLNSSKTTYKNKVHFSFEPYLYAVSIVLFITLVGFVSFILAYKPNQTNSGNVAQTTPTPTPSLTQKETEYKQVAQDRLKQLTGTSDIDLITEISKNSNFIDSGNPTVTKKPDVEEKLANVANSNIQDQKVFYTQAELKVFNGAKNTTLALPYIPDESKPIIIDTYITSNKYKTVSRQGSIVNLHFNTLEYSIDYKAGKYAIKTLFNNKEYFGGFAQFNPFSLELEFLKYIATKPNQIIEREVKVIDNKVLRVFETSNLNEFAGDIQESYKFYLDEQDFKLYIAEVYSNNKLVASIKNVMYKQYSQSEASSLLNIDEIKNIEIKEVKKQTAEEKKETLSEFIKKDNIYYLSSESKVEIMKEHKKSNDFKSLSESNDFDPTIEVKQLDEVTASYTQKDLLYTISDKKPVINSGKVTQKEIEITVDGVQIPATYYEVVDSNLKPEDGEKKTISIVFQKTKWYQVSEFIDKTEDKDKKSVLESTLVFVNLTEAEIQKLSTTPIDSIKLN